MSAIRYALLLSLFVASAASAQGSNLVQSDRSVAGGVPAEVLVRSREGRGGDDRPRAQKADGFASTAFQFVPLHEGALEAQTEVDSRQGRGRLASERPSPQGRARRSCRTVATR